MICLQGVKRPGRGVSTDPHLAPRLKKEWRYISTPLLGSHGLVQVEDKHNLIPCLRFQRLDFWSVSSVAGLYQSCAGSYFFLWVHTAAFCFFGVIFNPLNPELNPICYLLALLGAHHFLHVSRIRVKLFNP